MEYPTLYRRRFIPLEIVKLSKDKIVHIDEDIIVTSWETIKPRDDFKWGRSCYFIKLGYKISAFYRNDNSLLYYYCDIIDTQYDSEKNEYIFNDLLVDVVIDENGFVKVLDLNELPEALEKGLITTEQLKQALFCCDSLLNIIYNGKFNDLTSFLR